MDPTEAEKAAAAGTGSRTSRICGAVCGRPSNLEGEEGMMRRDSLERAELAADLLEVKWSTNLGNGIKAENGRPRPPVSCADGSGVGSRPGSQESVCSCEDIVGGSCAPALSKAELAGATQHADEQPCCCRKQFDEGIARAEENDVDLIGESGSVEYGVDRVQSSLQCPTSESSRLELDGSGTESHQALYLYSKGCGDVLVLDEACRVSEVHSPNKSMAVAANELNSKHLLNDGDGGRLFNKSQNLNITVSESAVSSVDVHRITSDATEHELFEAIRKDITAMTETLKSDISLETEEVNVMGSQSSASEVRESNLGESTMVSKPFPPIAASDLGLDSIHLAPSKEIHKEDTGYSQELHADCVPAVALSSLLPEGSEEAQFVFSDLDSKASGVDVVLPKSPDSVEKEIDSLVKLGRLEGVDKSITSNYESQKWSDGPVQENHPGDFEKLIEDTRMKSSAICIPSSRKAAGEGLGQVVRNLPNTWSHPILDLVNVRGPLSHSLDSYSESINRTLLSEGVSNSFISDAVKEHKIIQEWAEGNQILVELQNAVASGGVEISLCKHLLYEGMGAEAASQAFDSEKLGVDKFASISSDITKDDRLIVRMSNHYFPWDAAAPIILKMVSFGSERLLEPEGMIAVDEVENTLDGDPSEATIARSRSWQLWPFKRSNSKKANRATLNGSSSDAGKASESGNIGVDSDKDFSKIKVIRHMVRTITPTSEQLALLKLNEGRNFVTFTFSTTMLGKQQVDARIYLWKWNTRIVISDVDGTITKSDVLGQFMPMVGVDWSHTGVTHLFSAIQENGYEMLFLSARSISQACNTRQFLSNLKQNGKALPDGPVVISPDGLFPSLFREVIRRAPHEFKIACLEDIKALFPSDCNPFYAGFGNRDTDEFSYLKVGIPRGKIFIINPKGEVVVNRRIDTKSYASLHALVHDMFPPMSTSEQEDYNSWNFWKLPPPSIDV